MDGLPQRIGPYTIVGVLGEGGTGKVYLAEQTEPLRRSVALKVLASRSAPERVLAHFEIERLALAVMDHPSIAKVYDAGITDDGHPYVVMERVEGTPIGQFCDERRLTIRQRAAIFAEACRAVHHAHQKGVIHRDLKPSHILVSEVDGRARLRIIDFGIAMALEREGLLDVRRDDQEVVGTPGYMSPEQMEGSGDIDTRSDIYSLGVILYELLVGVPPFESGRRRGWAAVAAQLQDLPTPTSRLNSLDDTQDTVASHRGTTPRGLRRELHGDLDAIVARAMAMDRSRRYETARELWIDLERYLAHEPVQAVSGGVAYRARKFARRHRVGVAFTAAAAVGLAAVASTAALQAQRVAQARDEAELRRSQAEALIEFMLTDLRSRLEPLGRLDVLDAVGDQALRYLAAVPERYITDEELFRRVTALQLIGQVRLDQGNLGAAREAFESALELNLDLVERAPENAEWQVGLGASHFWVGFVQRRLGDLDGAEEQLEAYRAISEQLVARDASNQEWRIELAYSHSNLGSIRQDQGDLEAALREFTRARDLLQRAADVDTDNADLRLDLADTHNTVGSVLQGQGMLREALQEFRHEVRIKQTLVERDTANSFVRARLATGHNYLGQAFEAVGLPDSAMAQFQQAVGLWGALVARDSANAGWRRNLAMNRQRIASLLQRRGDLAVALAELRAVEAIMTDVVALDPADPGWRRDAANLYVDLAELWYRLGRPSDASASLRIAEGMLEALLEEIPGDADLVRLRSQAHNVTGLVRLGQGDPSGARDAWLESVRMIEPMARNSRDARYLTPWLMALVYLDRDEEARPVRERLTAMGYRDDTLTQAGGSNR